MNFQALVAVNLAGMLAWAAAPGGVVKANGAFRVDESPVGGNATLFDGAAVGTADVPSRIQLRNGTRVELASESRARFFGGRLALDQGFGEMPTSSGYRLEARGLRVSTAGAGSVARVRLDGEKAVLVADVKAETTLRFEPQSGAQDSFQMFGCLLRKAGKFILIDQTANQTVEVRGDAAQLGAPVGNRVQITGVADRAGQPVAGATLTVQAKGMEQAGLGGCLAAAAAAGADPACRRYAQEDRPGGLSHIAH